MRGLKTLSTSSPGVDSGHMGLGVFLDSGISSIKVKAKLSRSSP